MVAGPTMTALTAFVAIAQPAEAAHPAPEPAHPRLPATEARPAGAPLALLPLLLLGAVCALAYAVENAHQSWGAVFLTDTFSASAQLAAVAPATFAAAAALTRLTLAPLSRSHPVPLMIAGGLLATAGSGLLALAPHAPASLAGMAIAAVGTATLFPTLLSHSLREVAPAHRGRATSVIATTAYVGFLLGPAYVGLIAGTFGLRAAVLAVAALALLFTCAELPATRFARPRLARR